MKEQLRKQQNKVNKYGIIYRLIDVNMGLIFHNHTQKMMHVYETIMLTFFAHCKQERKCKLETKV